MNIALIQQVEGLLHDMTEEELERTQQVLGTVRRIKATQRAALVAQTLTPGTRVRLVGNLRPQYLLGLEGTVQQFPIGDQVTVKMDDPGVAPRYINRTTGELRAPLTCVEVIA